MGQAVMDEQTEEGPGAWEHSTRLGVGRALLGASIQAPGTGGWTPPSPHPPPPVSLR